MTKVCFYFYMSLNKLVNGHDTFEINFVIEKYLDYFLKFEMELKQSIYCFQMTICDHSLERKFKAGESEYQETFSCKIMIDA